MVYTPKYLTDQPVRALRYEFEGRVTHAGEPHRLRDALLDRAIFYLFWQSGLRLGEVEELRLEDLDLSARKLSVRNGKGMKDRTVYLTDTTVQALKAYLAMRGPGASDHVFLYRHQALCKDLVHSRIREAGKRTGVKVYPHRLRHTTATQLLNAGCPVTSIQKFLGHKKLNTTMVYAHAHDQTVEQDYFAAMGRIEQSKNMKDRMVYLSQATVDALNAYLEVRGVAEALPDFVFIFRHRPLTRSYFFERLRTYCQVLGIHIHRTACAIAVPHCS
jgi:integrase